MFVFIYIHLFIYLPGNGLTWVHIPVMDERPPTIEQIQKLVDTIEKAKQETVVSIFSGRLKSSHALSCLWSVCSTICTIT